MKWVFEIGANFYYLFFGCSKWVFILTFIYWVVEIGVIIFIKNNKKYWVYGTLKTFAEHSYFLVLKHLNCTLLNIVIDWLDYLKKYWTQKLSQKIVEIAFKHSSII